VTRLAALNARITGDSSGFVQAATQAETAAHGATAAMGVPGGGTGLVRSAKDTQSTFHKLSRSYGMRMIPVQLSQVAQQAAAGTGVMRALTIQAADIGMAFGVAGTIIGTLATIAMPVLIAAFSSGSEEAATFEGSLEKLSDVSSGLSEAQSILELSVDELIEKYGQYAGIVLQAARNLAELRAAQSRSILSEEIDLMTIALREYMMTSNSAFQSGVMQSRALSNIARDFGGTTSQVRALELALRQTRDAMTFEDKLLGMQAVNELLEAMGVDFAAIPPELRDALIEANTLTAAMAELAVETDKVATAAERIPGNLGMTFGTSIGGLPGSSLIPSNEELRTGRRDPADPPGSGRSEDQFEKDLERLQQQLATEIELEQEMHNMRNEMLTEALERELLTHEEFNDLIERERSRHHDNMAELDTYRYGSGIDQLQAFMGSMATAFTSGNEQMMQIAKVFGAGEALINAWRTFSQVMADPSLPWYAKIPAAASLFGTAMGAVNAIQSAGKGGSGPRAVSGGGGSAGATAAPAMGGGGSSGRSVSLTLIGESGFSRAQIVQIAEALNDSGDEGQQLMQIRGRR
jgi:hypothetical protein